MKVSQNCVSLVKEFEGYHKKLPNGGVTAYLDTLAARKYWSKGYSGLWTVGFGGTGLDHKGKLITKGTTWTRKYAEADLRYRLNKIGDQVEALVKVPLNQNQYDSLVSFTYNLGLHNLKKSSLLKKLNRGDYKGAAAVFPLYNKAGGKVYRGLVRRRTAERKLFELPAKKEIIKNSEKLSFLSRLRSFILLLTGGSALTWDNLTEVKQFASDHIGLIVLGIGAVVWLVAKYVEWRSLEDAAMGRWVPSGMVEKELEEEVVPNVGTAKKSA